MTRRLTLLLVLYMIAWAVAYHLMQDHYTLLSGSRPGSSYCNISKVFNCDAVTASSYARFMNVTLGGWGMGLYAVLILLTLGALIAARRQPAEPQRTDPWIAVMTLLLTLCSAFSLWLFAVSTYVLQVVCLGCTALHLIHFGSLALLISLGQGAFWQRLKQGALFFFSPQHRGRLGLALVCMLLMLFAMGWDRALYRRSLAPSEAKAQMWLNQLAANPSRNLNTAGAPKIGPDGAKLTIVEFSDFACPFCRKAAFLTKALLHSYRDRVQLVFKHYPMDNDCNPDIKKRFHPFSCEVARGSICAQAQGKFWEYHDALFAHVEPFTSSTAKIMATQLQLNLPQFDECMNSAEAFRQLKNDMSEAQRLGVSGTPAFYFNGRRLDGLIPGPVLQKIFDMELSTTATP